jgi:hypothetical protein
MKPENILDSQGPAARVGREMSRASSNRKPIFIAFAARARLR